MKLSITIASVPDREEVVAELWCGHQQWGEISQETETLKLELYSKRKNNGVWEFDFEEALNLMNTAKRRLLGLEET